MTGNTAKGIVASVVVHIIVCALLGFAALRIAKNEPLEAVYDVALVGAPGASTAPKTSAVPTPPVPPQPEAPPKPPEETPPPLPDDILEEKPPEEPPTPEPQPASTPQPPAETPPPAGGGAAAEGPGDAANGSVEGNPDGSGETQGIPPASDAIESPAVPPSVTSARAPEYPYSAQRKGIEGTVVVRFLLNKEGGVDDVDVVESSGNDALDRAAMEAAEGFSFSPGLDGYGRPVRCYAYQPFTFRLE